MVDQDGLQTQVLGLSKEMNNKFLELGRLLRQLQDTDPDQFRLTAMNTVGLRKAYYLMNVVDAFDKLKVPEALLRKIGWTKLIIIAKHVTKKNVRQLVKLADQNTAKNLEKLMKGEEAETNSHAVLMYFTPEQYEKLAAKLIEHGAVRQGRGLINKEKALIAFVESVG
jgi:hypothetical protein